MFKNSFRQLALATAMMLTPINIAVLNAEVHANPLPRSLSASNSSKLAGIQIAQRAALSNGTNIISPQNTQGRSTLKVVNGTGYDAVIKLVDNNSGKTQRFVYVPKNQTVVLQQIGTCKCTLKFDLGRNWNPNAQRFSQPYSFSQFKKVLSFTERRTASGVEWMNYTITLHRIPGGNASTIPISERNF